MPFTAVIPIEGNTDCTSGYSVQYKKSTATEWTDLENPPLGNSITLTGLDDCTIYNVRAVKTCCNGLTSTQTTINITTGGNCGSS